MRLRSGRLTSGPGTVTGLTSLSSDLILSITDRLSIASRITLALTCKSFFAFLFPTGALPRLREDERTELLLNFEKETPELFLCFACVRLCPFDPEQKLGGRMQKHHDCGSRKWVQRRWRDVGGHVYLSDVNHHPIDDYEFDWLATEGAECFPLHYWEPYICAPEIVFSEAHLIMNRHFYGRRYGLPITYLDLSFHCERFLNLEWAYIGRDQFPLGQHVPGKKYYTRLVRRRMFADHATYFSYGLGSHSLANFIVGPTPDPLHAVPWKFSHEYTTQIIDDELFVARHHSIRGPTMPLLVRYEGLFGAVGLPICRHLFCDNGYCLIPEVESFKKQGLNCSHSVGSCRCCFTDYEISISQNDGPEGFSLDLTTYHRLGACRSIDDPIWLSFTDLLESPARYVNHPDYPAGQVQRKWFNNMGMPVDVEAHWVPSPDEYVPGQWALGGIWRPRFGAGIQR